MQDLPCTGLEALQVFPCRCDINDLEETAKREKEVSKHINANFKYDDPYQLPCFTFCLFYFLLG